MSESLPSPRRDAGPGQVTELLLRWQSGHDEALGELLPLVYRELRTLARSYLSRERQGHTLQPTALVNEAFLRLVDQRRVTWQSRGHFFAIAAQCMRRVLVDYARRRVATKRGSDPVILQLDDEMAVSIASAARVVALDDALQSLERLDPRQSRIVELRYFGGLSIEEVADAVEISPATVKRDLATARLWLQRELSQQR